MKALETVVLRYTIADRIEFQNYAEFLRLMGIYVWEFPEEFHADDTVDSSDFGDSLVVDISCLLRQYEETGKVRDTRDLYEGLPAFLLREQENKDAKCQVNELLEASALLSLIYKKKALLHAATVLQYFRMKADEVEEAAGHFVVAAEEVLKVLENDENLRKNRHIRYAHLYCKLKANLGRWLCRQPLLELADDLANECLELTKEFPDFSNAWVLRGLAYETTDKYSKEAVESFNEAAQKVGMFPYASSIYYWIGKRCEGYKALDKMQLTSEAYEYAYGLDPKYRICYKMAFISERWYRWEDADRYYKACMDYVTVKGNYLDPLEQEYYYKSAIRSAYNCLAHLRNVRKAIRLLESAEQLRNHISSGREKENQYTGYYYDLYREKAQDYISLELRRMGTLQLHQYLAKAYQIIGNREKAVRYSVLFEKERERTTKINSGI